MNGIYLVIFGWLLNLPLLALLYFFIAKPAYNRVFNGSNKFVIFSISCLILLIIISITYVPGWLKFKQVCSKNIEPIINSVEGVSYFYNNDVNPNGPFLALRDLKTQFQKGQISFIEGPNIYKTKHSTSEPSYLRYKLSNEGKFEFQKTNNLKSIYGYRNTFSKKNGLHEHSTEIYKILDNSIISKETSFKYYGGYLSWLTFPFGIRECSNRDKYPRTRLDLKTFNLSKEN